MKRLTDKIARLPVDAKIDLLARAVFGDLDEETMKQTDGLLGKMAALDKKIAIILYGGMVSSFVVVLHFLGAPTTLVWKFASAAAAATLGK